MPDTAEKDNISIMRKRLLFRSWHRGTREMDIMLGRFAEAKLPEYDAGMLSMYEAFLEQSDPDIFNWVSGHETVPADALTPVMRDILDFYATAGGRA